MLTNVWIREARVLASSKIRSIVNIMANVKALSMVKSKDNFIARFRVEEVLWNTIET